ncbi:MAG: UDP-N-acetylmuramoyl-L-alanine--D-glutamate ligase [Ruminococcus sp.]|nr:UDP-N-acetylmuramoyl-L-alanine--D-glutamate ligase [Ruminococcus sp.]
MLDKYCNCKSITICDLNSVDKEANNLPESVKIITGESYQDSLGSFDILFKSPGIVLKSSPDTLDCLITSETQVFFEFFRSQIVGITGTKGKSTVSSLIYHILKESGKDCRLAGNIGIPVFDIAEDIAPETIIVCELSCHQLEYMSVSPSIAVMLNLYEEHLDHYGTMEKYAAAKKNIYLHQKTGDRLFCNYANLPEKLESAAFTLSNSDRKSEFFVADSQITCNMGPVYKIPADKIKLLGIHNHYNIAMAYLVCNIFAISDEEFTNALCTFNPLAHRLEFAAEINGVRYYDDSISTACATAIEALKSVPNPGTILLGGMDRGIDYTELIDFLNSFEVNVICMETSGKRIFDTIMNMEFTSPERVYYAEHLDEAVKLASEITPEGCSCVLSPAAASYGIFKNFEERGEVFKQLVSELKK